MKPNRRTELIIVSLRNECSQRTRARPNPSKSSTLIVMIGEACTEANEPVLTKGTRCHEQCVITVTNRFATYFTTKHHYLALVTAA